MWWLNKEFRIEIKIFELKCMAMSQTPAKCHVKRNKKNAFARQHVKYNECDHMYRLLNQHTNWFIYSVSAKFESQRNKIPADSEREKENMPDHNDDKRICGVN